MLSKIVLCLCIFASANTLAQALSFQTLKSARDNGMFRMTCSDTSRKMQAHLYLVIEKSKVTGVSLYAIAPGESVWSTDYSASDLVGLKTMTTHEQITVEGERPGAYGPQTFAFRVKEDASAKGQFKARLDWNSFDGEELHRDLICGAVNYVIAPAD